MLKGFLHGMFVFHQFLFMKQTYPVSILGRAIAILTHFFSEITLFFSRPIRHIPALKLNDVNLLFEGKRLPSLKSDKSLFTQLSFFLNHIHVCTLLSTQANLQFERVTSLYKYDRQNRFFRRYFYIIDLQKKSYGQK